MRNGITKNKKLLIDIWKMREVYILILLPVIWYIIFSYIPIRAKPGILKHTKQI